MSDVENLPEDLSPEDNEFEKALMEGVEVSPGQPCKGIIVKIDRDSVYIDIGYKSEGAVPLEEFDGLELKEGQEIEVLFKEETDDGVKLSYLGLQRQFVESTLEEGAVVKGKVKKLITRAKEEGKPPAPVGLDIDLGGGIRAFVSLSQMNLYQASPESYLGSEYDFLVERIEARARRRNIVLNRRKLLERDLEEKRSRFFSDHQVGDVVEGQVSHFTKFGAFIDLGGFSGLLHIGNIGWSPVKDPQSVLKLGETIPLKIVELDRGHNKIGLSRKELTANPWDTLGEPYQEGSVVTGRVSSLQSYGAFVELEEGIEGLIHISEMSWLKQIKHPREVLSVDDQVKVKILGIDLENRRISLGLRQTQENPWKEIVKRYPVGTRLTLPIKKVLKGIAFLNLEENVDGVLLEEELSWVESIKMEDFVKGKEEVEVQVISASVEDRRIALGVRQLSENPWTELRNYRKNAVIEGEVVSKTNFGIYLLLPSGVKGLIHKNDLAKSRDQNRDEQLNAYKIGSKVRALVLDIDQKRKLLHLSVKNLERLEERESISQYLANNKDEGKGVTIGDLLGKNIT